MNTEKLTLVSVEVDRDPNREVDQAVHDELEEGLLGHLV